MQYAHCNHRAIAEALPPDWGANDRWLGLFRSDISTAHNAVAVGCLLSLATVLHSLVKQGMYLSYLAAFWAKGAGLFLSVAIASPLRGTCIASDDA